MNRIPVDQTRMTLNVLNVTPNLDENKQQKQDRDGVPVWNIECLHRPEALGDYQPKADVLTVKVGSRAEPKINPMSEVGFVNLIARPWAMNGRNGISLSADGFADAKTGEVVNLPSVDGAK